MPFKSKIERYRKKMNKSIQKVLYVNTLKKDYVRKEKNENIPMKWQLKKKLKTQIFMQIKEINYLKKKKKKKKY